MFHTGDRVLVHTPYGLLPARVLAVEAADLFAVRPRHPHYDDAGQFFARAPHLRRPWDWPAEVQPLWSGRMATSEPATDRAAIDAEVRNAMPRAPKVGRHNVPVDA